MAEARAIVIGYRLALGNETANELIEDLELTHIITPVEFE